MVKESIRLILTYPAKSNSIFVGKFACALLALTGGVIDELALFAKNAFLFSQVKHAFGAVKTGFREVDCERSFFGTGGQVVIGGYFKEIHFVFLLRGASVKPVSHIEVRFEHMLVEGHITSRLFSLNFRLITVTILFVDGVVDDGDIIVLVLYLVIDLLLLIFDVRTVSTFLKELFAFNNEVFHLMNLREHV